MVQHHARSPGTPRIAHRGSGSRSLAWVARVLDYAGLFQPALSFAQAVLAARVGRGAIRLSAGDVLEFILTVWLAYVVSAFLRFVLQEDVYPRTQIDARHLLRRLEPVELRHPHHSGSCWR